MDLFEEQLEFAAEFSPCRKWRYILRRRWGTGRPLGFILLNPSTADERKDDPTIRRCIAYAKAWGYGGMVLGNLFGLRSTDPKALKIDPDPIGPGNDAALHKISEEVGGDVICGWGNHGVFLNRGQEVLLRLKAWQAVPMALALTGAGEPGHPLYLRGDLRPFQVPLDKESNVVIKDAELAK